MPFADLLDALNEARAARLVYEQAGPDGLRLYCYTSSCVYDAQWNVRNALSAPIHAAEVGLGEGVALLGGLPEERCCLRQVLGTPRPCQYMEAR